MSIPRLMRTSDFDFDLPEACIALRPADPRDSARLLVVKGGDLQDRIIRDLPGFLQPGGSLLFNGTRVIPARLPTGRHRRGPAGPAGCPPRGGRRRTGRASRAASACRCWWARATRWRCCTTTT